MRFQLKHPDRIVEDIQGIHSFTATLLNGRRITLLNNHAPILAILKEGKVSIMKDKEIIELNIQRSILKMRNNHIVLFCSAAPTKEKEQ